MQPMTERLMAQMKRECTLLTEFHDAETTMKARIHQKDWDGLDSVMREMSELADDLVETERARHEAFEHLRTTTGETADATFYQVIVHLPADERDALADLYRTMKFSVFGIQTAAACLDEHVRTLNDTMHGILEELYPHRKGKIYSPSGESRGHASNPLLIDREM